MGPNMQLLLSRRVVYNDVIRRESKLMYLASVLEREICFMSGEDITDETFGDYIKKLRVQRGLNKSELAKEVGVTRAYIGFIEAGNQPPVGDPPNVGASVLKQLAKALLVPEKEVFGRGYKVPDGFALAPIEYATDKGLQTVVERYIGGSSRVREALVSVAEVESSPSTTSPLAQVNTHPAKMKQA